MRTSLIFLSLFVAVTLNPAAAEVLYPYCAHYAGRSGGTNCGFTSFQQCQAAISGNGGYCGSNPRYFASAPEGRYRR